LCTDCVALTTRAIRLEKDGIGGAVNGGNGRRLQAESEPRQISEAIVLWLEALCLACWVVSA